MIKAMTQATNFAVNVRHMMGVRGLTQAELARLLDTSTPYVNKVLSQIICPSIARCEEIAAKLRVPLADLLLPPKKFAHAYPQRKSA